VCERLFARGVTAAADLALSRRFRVIAQNWQEELWKTLSNYLQDCLFVGEWSAQKACA